MRIEENKVPIEILEFLHKLNECGEFWLVGGCVRDLILDRTPKDWDVVTTTPEVMDGYQRIGKDFPVWQARVAALDADWVHTVEIASARTERKIGRGHGDFEVEVTKSLPEDLRRRDLTINAMAWRPGEEVVDPWGAEADLRDQTLRHVSEAFAEDPLRVFRVVRFWSQLKGSWGIAPETLDLMRDLADDTRFLPADRVREELSKALRSPAPWRFFLGLHKARAILPWFPEMCWEHGRYERLLMYCADLRLDEDCTLAALGSCLDRDTQEFCDRLGYGRKTRQSMDLVRDSAVLCHLSHKIPTPQLLDLLKRVQRGPLGLEGFIGASEACWRNIHHEDLPYLGGAFLRRMAGYCNV